MTITTPHGMVADASRVDSRTGLDEPLPFAWEAAFSRRQILAGTAGLLCVPWLSSPASATSGRVGSPVSGTSSSGFAAVRREFEKNFAERGEVGASLCVIVDGQTVVDLSGGTARSDGTPWTADTLCHVWSSTKGATSLCAHLLIDRGELDLAAPVVKYWPEFGQAGKEKTTVAMLLAHQAGVPAIRERLPQGAFYDWELMVDVLARQAPFWEPGTRNGYHALTFGFLVGELVRRVSGRSLGKFFEDEVAGPLGLDFWIGLPATEEHRVAPTISADAPVPGEPLAEFLRKAFTEPDSIPALAFLNSGGYINPGESDSRAAHAAEIGATGGMTTARALARMYASLDDLLGHDTLARMARVASATSQDATAFLPTRFALGYVKSMDNRRQPPGFRDSVILGEEAFGHSGFGGSIGFADPAARLSFGYTMNKMGQGTGLNERGQSLVDAVYRALGYASNDSGSWVARRSVATPSPCGRRIVPGIQR